MNHSRPLFSLLSTTSFFLLTLYSQAVANVKVEDDVLNLEKQVTSTVEQVKNSVVALVMKDESGKAMGSGSGVIVSEKGLIYTAAHVVDGFNEVTAIMADQTEHRVKVLGMNRYKDAAVCRMIDSSKTYPYSAPGNSDNLQVTDWVIAMGHGRGYDKNRTAPVRFGRLRAHNPGRFITTDCPLIGGDSGGPVFDLNGKVVAINSSINGLAKFNVHAGVSGFQDDLQRMRSGESWGELLPNVLFTPETPLLGVAFSQNRRRQNHHLLRPLVEAVTKDGPAEKAGIKAGDLIRKIGEEEINNRLDLEIALGRQKVGQNVKVIIQRSRDLLETEVVLTKREEAEILKNKISSPQLSDNSDSPYVKEKDKPLLEGQAQEIFSWVSPLGEAKKDTYVQLFNRKNIRTPLLNATVIKKGIALAPLSAYLSLPKNLIAWRPGLDVHPVTLIGAYQEHDLAVLSIEGITSSQNLLENIDEVKVGEFLCAVSNTNNKSGVIKLGVVSVEKRNLTGRLGIGISDLADESGVSVTQIDPTKTAFLMGVRKGSIIKSVNDTDISNGEDLLQVMSETKVGDTIKISFLRRGQLITAEESLGGKGNESGRIDMMDQLGRNKLSKNRDSFQVVIQSDMLVEPEECGAPVYTLDGSFAGIAVSDAGRNKTYILPANAVKEALNNAPQEIKKPSSAQDSFPSSSGVNERAIRQNGIPRGSDDIMKRHQELMERILRNRSNSNRSDPRQMMEDFEKRHEELMRELLGR